MFLSGERCANTVGPWALSRAREMLMPQSQCNMLRFADKVQTCLVDSREGTSIQTQSTSALVSYLHHSSDIQHFFRSAREGLTHDKQKGGSDAYARHRQPKVLQTYLQSVQEGPPFQQRATAIGRIATLFNPSIILVITTLPHSVFLATSLELVRRTRGFDSLTIFADPAPRVYDQAPSNLQCTASWRS
jgi:hypothetical protein